MDNKKRCENLRVAAVERLSEKHVLLRLTSDEPLPTMLPGQFVQILVDNGGATYLRRPISVNWVDVHRNEMWLLIAAVGEGTKHLCRLREGDTVNVLFPLGGAFTLPEGQGKDILLVGGGVGVAPMYFQGKCLKEAGHHPHFLLGARSRADLLELDYFQALGPTYCTTEDGSYDEKGRVTDHSILQRQHFDFIQTCGPKPMMMAVARYAKAQGIGCEVSLENLMACGIGACLCCVEKTVEGNVCVCTEGPVFNMEKLLW